MQSRVLRLTAASLACLALSSAGCIVTHYEPSPAGVLSVAWTIQSSTSPARCAAIGADSIAIDVYEFGGRRILTDHEPCEAFVDNIGLDPGHYSLDITLVDIGDHAVTTTSSLDVFIRPDGETDVDVDFPSSSFL